jgi:hypothetical protein
MTEKELLQGHVRARVTASRIFIEVKKEDESSEVLSVRWALAAALPLNASPLHVDRVRLMTLNDYRHFRVCDACGQRLPAAMVRSLGDGTDRCRECDK